MTPWWQGIPPLTAAMPCGSGHHGRWERGQLHVTDLDAEAEEVLAALGGTGCRCVELLRAWNGSLDPIEVLLLGPRSADDRIAVDTARLRKAEEDRRSTLRLWERQRSRADVDATGGGSAAPDEDPTAAAWERTVRLRWLLTLPNGFQRRLVAGAGHDLEQRWDGLDARDRARAAAALTGRLRAPLRRSLVAAGAVDGLDAGSDDLDFDLDLAVAVGPPSTAPHLTAEVRGPRSVRIGGTIGVDWLRTVWGRDVASMGAGVGLEVTGVTASRAVRGRAVRWMRRPGNTELETVVEEWENDVPPDGEPPSQE